MLAPRFIQVFNFNKKQASNLIVQTALNCNCFYVNEKWLGGMLTNWNTISLSTKKLQELEIQEQKGLFNKLPKKKF